MSSTKKPSARKLGLTSAQKYEAAWLKHQANVLVSFASHLPRLQQIKPLPVLLIDDSDRWRIAHCLRRIAEEPTALKAITRTPRNPRRRGAPAKRTQTHKIGLEYQVVYQNLGKSDAAIAEMRPHWKISRSGILKAYKNAKLDKHWQRWAENLLKNAKANGESQEEIIRRIRQS